MPHEDFIEHMFLSSAIHNKPIDFAITNSHASFILHLFGMKEVRDRYTNSDPLIYRLIIFLFGKSSDYVINYILSSLNIGKDKVIQMMNYKCPSSETDSIHKFGLINGIIWLGKLKQLERFIEFVGKQVFIENACNDDGMERDSLRTGLYFSKVEFVEYVLSFGEIRAKYMSDSYLLHSLCRALNANIEKGAAIKCIVDALGLTEAKLEEISEEYFVAIDRIVPFTK